MDYRGPYDVIVVGGGHAGAEAAWAAANVGARVGLITMDTAKVGTMSCNPAIGGLAKGQMVREIDAMGGLMGRVADATGIQFRMLNASKGPAVRGPRCQSDKYRYAREVQRLLASRTNVDVFAGTINDILVQRGRVVAVSTTEHRKHRSLITSSVVLTTGTFMRGLMHSGAQKRPGGRIGEQAATGISRALCRLGFELGRLKTGTPPRLAAETIDYAGLERQDGDCQPQPFSDMTNLDRFPSLPQQPCYLTHTNESIHDLIRANLNRAPMYNGQITTAGPRYCPSIEDKVVRFADRRRHHIFLEPESLETNEVYCNGISTSLPADVQRDIVRQLPGCEHARILQAGYAVEYDMVWPHQIDATCMTKRVDGLFLAGQINGTSGYEEAAGQGLVAGLNAARWAQGKSLVRLQRDQAYIGVLMDDLVTKTPQEPYRMFTSRAEFRLQLRADNADSRLTCWAYDLGLVDHDRWTRYQEREAALVSLRQYVETQQVDHQTMKAWLSQGNVNPSLVSARLNRDCLPVLARDHRVIVRLLADLLYDGYLERQRRDVNRMLQQETRTLPVDLDYTSFDGLRAEAQTALSKFRPATFGQAGRLAGVTPADLMIVTVQLDRQKARNTKKPSLQAVS